MPSEPGTPVSYTEAASSPCRGDTESLELTATAPVGRARNATAPAGWLKATAAYDLEVGYPLTFRSSNPLFIGGRCYAVAANRTAAQKQMQAHANRVALGVVAVSSGYIVTEAMRPELFNWRPLMRVHLVLESIGKSLVCVVGAVTWALEANNAVGVLELYPIGEMSLMPSEPIEPFAQGLPGAQEAPVASGAPVPAKPSFTGTPFSTLISGPAPAAPPLVDGEGDPVALPNLRAGVWLPWLVPSTTTRARPRPFCRMKARIRSAFSWRYGAIRGADVSGLPLRLGTFSAPYATSYDLGGFAEDATPPATP